MPTTDTTTPQGATNREMDVLRVLQALNVRQPDKVTAHSLGSNTSHLSRLRNEARNKGFITRENVTILDPRKFKLVLAFFHVKLKFLGKHPEMETFVASLPEIQEAHTLMKDQSMILKVRARSNEALQDLKEKLWEIESVENVVVQVAGLTTKETTELPI